MNDYVNYTDHSFTNPRDAVSLLNWRVRKQPIYRLLDNKQWLDNFFSQGELALSSFSKFKSYPDEIRGDKEEGEALIWFENESGDTHAFKYESGMNSYIICTTMEITDEVIRDFGAVGAIKIHNSTYFALEIMRTIPGCKQGIEGKCIYNDSRVYRGYSDKMEKILTNNPNLDYSEIRGELMEAALERELFLKLNKYQLQNEYRMLWFVDHLVSTNLFIKVPKAIQYCERIDF